MIHQASKSRYSGVYNVITTRLLIVSCNNIVFTITTALYAGSVYNVLHSYHASYNTYPSWGLYRISAQTGYGKSSCWPWQHPGESPTYILHKNKTYNTRKRFFVKLSINNHIGGLIHKKKHIIRTCLMYHAAWKTLLGFNHSNGRTHSWRFSTFVRTSARYQPATKIRICIYVCSF